MKLCSNAKCNINISHKDYRAKYCSRSCAAVVNNSLKPKRIKKIKPIKKTKIERWLCSEWDATVKSGVSSIVRNYLLNQALFKCQDGRSNCNNWSAINPKSGKSCLTIDHIDGNSQNNNPENLKVMCPNCHSMTTTYGALNKGNGRKSRYIQSAVA